MVPRSAHCFTVMKNVKHRREVGDQRAVAQDLFHRQEKRET
jgi:hypothetical protein